MNEDGSDSVEFLITNLPEEVATEKELKDLILTAMERRDILQSAEKSNEDGEYVIKRNFNKTLGTMKRYFLKMLMCEDEAKRQKLQEKIWMNINGAICWVKKGERQFSRKQSVNKSSISYRKCY